jgi:L-ribulokinase
MRQAFIIGLDFGTASARGVLMDAESGHQRAVEVHAYRHGVISGSLPNGHKIPRDYVLQDPADYIEALEIILRKLASGLEVVSIGIGCTACSPLLAYADGVALLNDFHDEPHAYVKLWKHSAAQRYADAISAQGGDFLEDFGGRVSGEWMLPKALEIRGEAPVLWNKAERFIEAGDWIVWQLTGREARSQDFACFKAQFRPEVGYPSHIVPGLAARLSDPLPVGSPAGTMTAAWCSRTGVIGRPVVAVASIDSHVVLPAVGAIRGGAFVGALGTSAGFLALSDDCRRLPCGLEGAGFGAALPNLWCCEAGQAAFGDMLTWFVETFPLATDLAANFSKYNAAAAEMRPQQSGILALDWFGGNRIPSADSTLSGLLVGLRIGSTGAGIYRSLVESLCFGTRLILELTEAGGVGVDDVILTSGLAHSNTFLVSVMADVLGRKVSVPQIENPTAVGAAIHGAVAGGVAGNFFDGNERFGAKSRNSFEPDLGLHAQYEVLYSQYKNLVANQELVRVMHRLYSASLNT